MATADIFTTALLSDGPHASLTPEAQIFAPFIGSWDLQVRWYEPDGRIRRQEQGEWHFAWVLEGRAVQDVRIVPPRVERAEHADLYEYGTSLRFFDPTVGAWRSTWIGPMQRAVHTFLARRIGQEVVLESTPDSPQYMQWIFSDITANSFAWRNQRREGSAWLLTQAFQARRRLDAGEGGSVAGVSAGGSR